MEIITGALPSVLAKLGDLLIVEYNLQKGVIWEIRCLRYALGSMQPVLKTISNVPAYQLDNQEKVWARELRELSYEIEDSIEEFMVRAKDKIWDAGLFSQAKVNIAAAIGDINSHLRKVSELRDRYKTDTSVAKLVTDAFESCLLDHYNEVTEPVGIDEARDELIGILMQGTQVSNKQANVVSIVGSAGLGKTTLANAVYGVLRERFECCAFVTVSRTPNIMKLLKDMLYQLGKNMDVETLGAKWFINEVIEFLQDKRYLIVIDDIGDISDWEIIKCALPDNNTGPKIITTTCILTIAEQVGVAFKMKPLSPEHSRKLLYRGIFGSENKDNNEDTVKELVEVSNGILNTCAGVPLAIVTVARMLACKARNKMEWYKVYNSISASQKSNPDMENKRKIVTCSFYNLPSHLRTCLLYFSMFLEDYKIDKDRLIWMWIAEGFIECGKQEESLFEIGEIYLNELINRSMVQPIHDTYTGSLEQCHVNDMVIDLIHSFSSEENSVTILNDMDSSTPSSNTIWRLSLQNGKENHAMVVATMNLQQVRSVVVFPTAISLMPSLGRFRVLRVLDLENCYLSQRYSLKFLEDLLHLRYLGLRNTGIAQLPEEIENLQFLQTLDVRDNGISRLPQTVSQLRHLMCLRIDGVTEVPNGIGNLRCLEELSVLCLCSSDSKHIIDELVHLKKLRVLHVFYCDEWNESLGKSLLECLSKLQNIQNLYIRVSGDCNLDSWVAPRCLRSLELWGSWFSRLQAWINPLFLLDLSFLSINVRMLHQEDLEILGRLPALRYLRLNVDHENCGIFERFVIGAFSFPCLLHCRLFGFTIPVVFRKGAMWKLASLELTFSVQEMREITAGGFDFGLEYLSSLQNVTIFINHGGGSEDGLEEMKAALVQTTELHPNQPTLRVVTDIRDGKSLVEQVSEQHDSYRVNNIVANPAITIVHPRVLPQHIKTAELVGIEESIDDLMGILFEGNNEASTQQGNIVSVVGFGGMGKTTVANELYKRLRAQFDCRAFVSVSHNPDMKNLFKCMLYQLGKRKNANIHEEILDERVLMYELIELLQNKRYFIVIDDICDFSVWEMIRCALPDNNDGYTIITTTRNFSVAIEIGGAYKLKSLCPEDSRTLFCRRVFESGKDKYHDEQQGPAYAKILSICDGVPLAIIMAASLLASKTRNRIEWHKACDSLGIELENYQCEDNTRKILSLSYDNLPSYLRTCLLYLSVFPEGYDIDKDRLIRLWIAEGLIQCEKQGESLYEIGESYFYELMDRSMIQPVYKRWYYDMIEYCRVHDMVHDLICFLSGRENFVSILNHVHHMFLSKDVRWLSLQSSTVDHATHRATISMSEVRSVFVFPSAVNMLPALESFRVLRVLDLQSCCLSQGCSLNYLGNLSHLRYLGLRDTGIAHLSEEIGKLRFLQTLDVKGNEICNLPSTVVELKHLMCLRIDSWTRAPNGIIGSFTSLEELSTLRIQDSTELIENLGNQAELRMLGINCRTGWNAKRFEKSLVECLQKLQKIHTLSISVVGECKLDAWVAPRHLRRLELTGCLSSRLAAWLNPSLLLELSFLSIDVRKLRQEDLEILGRLPALVYLDLEVGNQSHGILRQLAIGASSFPCLVQCTLRGYIEPVVFQQGAIPRLARLHLTIPVRETREIAGGFDLGLGNLPLLQDVTFLLRRAGAREGEVEEANAALRHAIEIHPHHPTLEILS